ncbi:MAG: 30S ribosomal protein S8 [Nitrospirae bacterium]|nr:30S ribosomal protein S8 [Nitrospirota bacterium]
MSMTDPVADLLTRIRNANTAKHEWVDIPSSKMKLEIVRILKEEGFINDFKLFKDNKQGIVRVNLKFNSEEEPVISGIKRISKPGRRIYVGSDKIPRVMGGVGIAILSTPKGICTGLKAKKEKIGGEVLCYVW